MEEGKAEGRRYKTYRRRWLVLLTVTLLNLSNNAIWISYSAIANVATEYFQKSPNEIDLLATISFYVGIPMCLVSTFVVDALGLRAGMFLGTSLTFLGGLVRCLSTLPGLNDKMSLNVQFILSVTGQALAGMGNPLAVSVPTKVSQNWFPESERLLATGVLAMSLPLGIVLGQLGSPLIVKCGEDVPLMNILWLIPAAITMVLCVFTITSSAPPSPPSKSAEMAGQEERKSFRQYLSNMAAVFTNGPYMVLFVAIGGAVGFFNAFSTQLSQLMCARGYDNVFSGLCGSLLLGTGFIGSIVTGVLVEKYGKMEELTKLFYGIAGICGILIAEFMRLSDMKVAIALFCSLFGVFGFGCYPLGLELSVEATYPVDESIGTALIFMSGQIQGGILVFASQMLEEELPGDDLSKEVCSIASSSSCSTESSSTPFPTITPASPDLSLIGKDHTNFLLVIAGYLTALVVIFIIFFSTKFKRTIANQMKEETENSDNHFDRENSTRL